MVKRQPHYETDFGFLLLTRSICDGLQVQLKDRGTVEYGKMRQEISLQNLWWKKISPEWWGNGSWVAVSA